VVHLRSLVQEPPDAVADEVLVDLEARRARDFPLLFVEYSISIAISDSRLPGLQTRIAL
jgi:hypothetical protein